MTLVFSSFGHLIQHSFGANEIASMISIGKSIGSVVTRQSDASIFEPLANEYAIRVTQIPPWLRKVEFDRRGTILGSGQREVHVPNTLTNVNINSIEGVATFLVLILRYVESSSDIIEDMNELLRGRYGVIHGGVLQLGNPPMAPEVVQQRELPYSLRGVLRSFINGVTDADAVSTQRRCCMTMMCQLSSLVGSTKFLNSSIKFVKLEHQKLLSYLLSTPSSDDQLDDQCFNTLSAGAAMISLAAAANGANVILECVKDDGVIQLDVPGRLSHYARESPRIVRLWLTQPPATIMEEIKMGVYEPPEGSTYMADLPSLPVYGGMSEISCHVSRLLGCDISPEEALALWKSAVSVGREAQLKARRGIDRCLSIVFDEDFLKSNVPASIGRLADKYYNAPRGDNRHRLARKAASVLHQVFNYSDYITFGEDRFRSSLSLTIIALFVGILERLIKNTGTRMMSYAWTLDCERTLGLAQTFTDIGLSQLQILTQAAGVWGGVTPRHRMVDGEVDVRVIGIICPQIIFLCNVLLDPKEMARVGISKGFMTWYEGSSPILPREQDTGYVLAARPPYTRPGLFIDAEKPLPRLVQDDGVSEDFDSLLFSAEPCAYKGSLGILLCVWHRGDLMMVLDPHLVLTNLLSCRSIFLTNEATSREKPSVNAVHLTPGFLQWLECGFHIHNGFGIIDVSGRPDWQVVSAGINPYPLSSLISDDLEKSKVRSPEFQFWDRWVVILGGQKEDPPTHGESHAESLHANNNSLVHEDIHT